MFDRLKSRIIPEIGKNWERLSELRNRYLGEINVAMTSILAIAILAEGIVHHKEIGRETLIGAVNTYDKETLIVSEPALTTATLGYMWFLERQGEKDKIIPPEDTSYYGSAEYYRSVFAENRINSYESLLSIVIKGCASYEAQTGKKCFFNPPRQIDRNLLYKELNQQVDNRKLDLDSLVVNTDHNLSQDERIQSFNRTSLVDILEMPESGLFSRFLGKLDRGGYAGIVRQNDGSFDVWANSDQLSTQFYTDKFPTDQYIKFLDLEKRNFERHIEKASERNQWKPVSQQEGLEYYLSVNHGDITKSLLDLGQMLELIAREGDTQEMGSRWEARFLVDSQAVVGPTPMQAWFAGGKNQHPASDANWGVDGMVGGMYHNVQEGGAALMLPPESITPAIIARGYLATTIKNHGANKTVSDIYNALGLTFFGDELRMLYPSTR